jgi:glycosyltransferase involved in cell wall biosynthesis
LHLHWLYGLYMSRLTTPFRLAAFLGRVNLAKRLGYKIVWTAHNILPHRQPFPPMHRMVRRFVMGRADAVISHCEYGRRELLRRFPGRTQVHVVACGNYAGAHVVTLSRSAARESLGIDPQAFVYLVLGNLAPYKGIGDFVEAFQDVATASDVALIAGRNRAPALVTRLESLSAKDPRIQVHAGFVAEDDMQRYIRAADVMVASFKEVLTSSSVILGMTYGLPIIAPARGCLPELVTPDAGILYDPESPAALGRALLEIKGRDITCMGAAAGEIAAALTWDGIARQTAGIYRRCCA